MTPDRFVSVYLTVCHEPRRGCSLSMSLHLLEVDEQPESLTIEVGKGRTHFDALQAPEIEVAEEATSIPTHSRLSERQDASFGT